MKTEIASIRTDYMLKSLIETGVKDNAMDQFSEWWSEALDSDISEVNAMTVATIDANGFPYARICLLKSYDEEGFVFFTNYESAKGRQLEKNPKVCLLFFWKELERQVTIFGEAEKLDASSNDEYFYSRPRMSQVGAWTSPQSQPIANREFLESRFTQLLQQFGEEHIPRPPHWGGYLVKPVKIEFWQGRQSRLHDRILYTKNGNNWNIERIAP